MTHELLGENYPDSLLLGVVSPLAINKGTKTRGWQRVVWDSLDDRHLVYRQAAMKKSNNCQIVKQHNARHARVHTHAFNVSWGLWKL